MTKDDQLGTKELEEVVDFIFDITDAIRKSVADDDKVTVGDAPKFFKALLGSGSALGGINKIPAEIANLTEAELKGIVEKVRERYDIKDDILEAYVENAIYNALQLSLNISNIYKLRK
jgi:dihydrodipicolinate synthase/N-acetylneuraminate lyase